MISGLNRTAFGLAVYASQGRLPAHHARLASGCWPGSAGRDWLPAGFRRKVSHLWRSPFPELLGAMTVQVTSTPSFCEARCLFHKSLASFLGLPLIRPWRIEIPLEPLRPRAEPRTSLLLLATSLTERDPSHQRRP